MGSHSRIAVGIIVRAAYMCDSELLNESNENHYIRQTLWADLREHVSHGVRMALELTEEDC